MSQYSIVFEGRIGPGERPEAVKRRLAVLYRVDLARIERLFSGRTVIIKNNLDRESAHRKKAAFEKTGARCRIVSPANDVSLPAPPIEPRTDSLFQPLRKARKSRRFRIYQPLYMAFYSKTLYRDAAHNWKGFAYTYLLFLIILSTLVSAFQIQRNVSDFLDRSAGALVRQIPEILISEGEILVDGDQPYVIVDPETGKDLAILDTTGQVTSLQDTEAVILLTRSQLIYRKSARETRILELSEVEHLHIDHQTLQAWIEVIRQWSAVAVAPFILIGSIVYRLFQVLLYVLIAWVMVKIIHTALPFHALVSIAVVSITPALIILLLSDLAGFALPQSKFLSFLITSGFLFFAVRASAGQAAPDLRSRQRA